MSVFDNIKSLDTCNPPFAHKALLAEDKIGLMLPCNAVIQEVKGGHSEVAAIDPVTSMAVVEKENLKAIAMQIREKLQKVIESL